MRRRLAGVGSGGTFLGVRARFDLLTRRVSALDLAAARWLAAALLLPLSLAACGGSSDPKNVPANAAAIVGAEPITRAALASVVASTRRADELKGRAFPAAGTADFRVERNKLLDGLVEEAEFEQHAHSQFGIEIDDAQVERELEQLRSRTSAGSEKLFKQALAQQGLTEEQVRARFRRQLLGEAVFAKLSADASVSGDEIERYYNDHHAGYEQPATRRVSHILVTTRAEADEVERRLRNGADFAALAKRYSIDTATAPSGGALARIAKGQTLPAFDRAAFSLKTNAVSEPVHTKTGWHIIRATSDVTPATTTPLAAVRSTIESALLTTKRQNALEDWAKETRKAYAPRVRYAPEFGPA
jgi:parvulin-like peptidyl-prolyl isomerase